MLTSETVSHFTFIAAEETDQFKNVNYLKGTAETFENQWKPV